jgi:predicted O-methyltransferase YrrM
MIRQGSLSVRIVEYERSLPDHRAGTVDANVLQVIEDLAPRPLEWSMETGCGKTTILLSNLSNNHHVFAYDDRAEERSSIAYYSACPLFRPDRTTEVLGATQLTLPAFAFGAPIDLALLDGPHGYPFPELEYYYVYPKLRPGALLIVDDIHIPSIHRLHTFLAEDDMFRLVHVERTTAFFVRTAAPAFYPLGDGWELQAFNKARFPVTTEPGPAPAAVSAPPPDTRVKELEDRLAATEKELAWWKVAAEERRLKRRLARRLGDWPFLR